MAYQFKDKSLAKLSKKVTKKKVTRRKNSSSKRRKTIRRAKRAPAHFPSDLARELGYAPVRKTRKKKSKKRKSKSTKKVVRRSKPRVAKKKTKAQIHAMRVRQGKRLAAMRKAQLKKKGRRRHA